MAAQQDQYEIVMKLDDAAAHLEALGNPTRLKIYRALVRAGEAGLPVGKLQDRLKIAPSTLSHHIKTLVTVGLITQIREAKTLVCHANYGIYHARACRFPRCRVLRRRGREQGDEDGRVMLAGLEFRLVLV